MMEKKSDPFAQADLSQYDWRQKLTIRLAARAFYILIKTVGSTLKFEIEGAEYLDEIKQNGKLPIFCFWHEQIFAATYYFRNQNIIVLTSQSFDGEYIARFIKRFGYGAARGSSTRGGVGALIEMIRLMKNNFPAALTIDGPKGPPRVAKSGAGFLAKKTGNPIVPISFAAEKFRAVGSWDKLQIPKMFSRVKIIVAKPFFVEARVDDAQIETARDILQAKLDESNANGEQWRNSFI